MPVVVVTSAIVDAAVVVAMLRVDAAGAVTIAVEEAIIEVGAVTTAATGGVSVIIRQ